MRVRVIALGLFACLAPVADLSAQTCLGLPSFARAPFQASAGLTFTDGATGFGGGVALGSDDIFGGLGVQFTDVDGFDSTATSFKMNLGASYVVNDRERIEACPVAGVIVTSGPDIGDVDVSGVGLRAGGRLGLVVMETGTLELVPTFGLDIAYDRLTFDASGVDVSESDTYMIARAGLGLVFNRNIGVVTTLGVPLGLDGADPEVSIVVSYMFGSR